MKFEDDPYTSDFEMQKTACWFSRYLEEVRYMPSQANGICACASEGVHFVRSWHYQVGRFSPENSSLPYIFFIRLVKLPQSKEWRLSRIHHCVKSVHIWSFSGPYFPAFD